MLERFIADESGAISVDWVVMSATGVSMALAMMSVVSGGMENLSNDMTDDIATSQIAISFSSAADLLSTDFASGIGDWFGGTAVTLDGFGEVLQIGPNETAQVQVQVPEGAESATITFDLIAADDMNNDPATIMVNGQAVAVYRDNHGNVSWDDNAVSGITISAEQHYNNSPVGAGDHGHDSRITYTITVDDPSTTMTFGVHSGSDEGIHDEFYAIDDVSIVTA